MPTDPQPTEVQRELDAIDAALAGRPVDPELSELGALAVALREERPGPTLEFTSDLDRRVADGFRKERRRRRRLAWPGVGVLAPVMAAMLLALVVVPAALIDGGRDDSGSAGGGSTAASGGAAATEESADSAAQLAPSPTVRNMKPQPGSAGGSPAASVGIPAPVPPPGGGSPRSDNRTARKVERSASITLVAEPAEIHDVAARILDVARANGGFVVNSSVGSVEGGGGGQFLLRVRTDRLDNALAQLGDLARVGELNRQMQDITAQHTSARDRLQDARAERRSLLRRLARAVTDAEVTSLKAQLRDVGARIAAAKTDLSAVSNRASYANVAVSLTSDPDAEAVVDDGRWSPGDAAKDALRVLEVAAGVVLIALAVALPLGLLLLAGLVAVRWSARRGRERALDAV